MAFIHSFIHCFWTGLVETGWRSAISAKVGFLSVFIITVIISLDFVKAAGTMVWIV